MQGPHHADHFHRNVQELLKTRTKALHHLLSRTWPMAHVEYADSSVPSANSLDGQEPHRASDRGGLAGWSRDDLSLIHRRLDKY